VYGAPVHVRAVDCGLLRSKSRVKQLRKVSLTRLKLAIAVLSTKYLADIYWSGWLKRYLLELRRKCTKIKGGLEIRELVLLNNSRTTRNSSNQNSWKGVARTRRTRTRDICQPRKQETDSQAWECSFNFGKSVRFLSILTTYEYPQC
jgi:hypothetical protein